FNVFQNYGYTIEENQSIFLLMQLGFLQPYLPYFITSVVLLFLSLLLNWRETKPIDWLLALCLSFVAISASRNLPLLFFAIVIPFTKYLSIIVNKFDSLIRSKNRHLSILFILFIISLVVLQIFIFISSVGFGYKIKE